MQCQQKASSENIRKYTKLWQLFGHIWRRRRYICRRRRYTTSGCASPNYSYWLSYTTPPLPTSSCTTLQGNGLVATCGKDTTVRLWRLLDSHGQATPGSSGGGSSPSQAVCVASYSGHADAVEEVAVSPDGSRLASCGWDGAILLWRTGRCYLLIIAQSVS